MKERCHSAQESSLGIRDHHRFILNIRAGKLALHWQQEEVLWRETCHQHAAKKMLPLIISLSITMGSVYTGWYFWSEVLVTQLCLTLCDPMDCSLPGSSDHGILQAWLPELVAIPFSRGFSWSSDQTQASCIAGWFFTIWTTTGDSVGMSVNTPEH